MTGCRPHRAGAHRAGPRRARPRRAGPRRAGPRHALPYLAESGGAARLYRLPRAKASWICANALALALVTTLTLLVGPRLGLLPTLCAAALGLVASLAAFDRHAVIVGTDGVLHREGLSQRFARYESIVAVHHLPVGSPRNQESHGVVELVLKNGATLRIGTDLTRPDRLGRALARRIRRRRHRALADGDHARVEALLLRGNRTLDEWLAALDRLRRSFAEAYRSASSPEELWLVLDDEGAKLTARVGAALVLREPRAFRRLRRIAEDVADPVTRGVIRTLVRARGTDRLAAMDALHDRGVYDAGSYRRRAR